MSDSNLSPEEQDRQDAARVNGKYGEQPRYAGEGAGGYLDPTSAWDDLGEGDSLEWYDGEISSEAIDSLTLHRSSEQTDEENGTPSSLFVQATQAVDLQQTFPSLSGREARERLSAQADDVDAFVRWRYNDAYPLPSSPGTQEHTEIQFAADEDDLAAGETFPTDVQGLSTFILDKSEIGSLHTDVESGLFHTHLKAFLDTRASGSVRHEDAKGRQIYQVKIAAARTAAGRDLTFAETKALADEVLAEWPDKRHAPSLNFAIGTGR